MSVMEYTDSAIVDTFYNESGTGIFQSRKYYNILRKITPSSTLTIDVTQDGIYQFFDVRKEHFKELIKEAVFRFLADQYPTNKEVKYDFRNIGINFVTTELIKMHKLNAREHERAIVTFECELIAVEKEKTYVKSFEGVCPLCYKSYQIKSDYERNINESYCTNIRCKKAKLNINKNSLVTDNIQFVYLQELLSDAKNNTPIILRGVALDHLSGTLYVGQKKRITGLYKSLVDLKTNINEIVIEIMSADDLEIKHENCLTKEDLDMIKSESTQEGFIDKIVNSFAPIIIGHHDIKLSILLMLAGGHSKVKRSDINILLVGDPSLAKSELLKECSKISNKSMYTSGRGASAAGLTIGLVKMENGNYVAQAGVLPLCNEGHACIDEFDKMNPNDRSSMHEGMEQQTVSIAKAGFRMTLPAKTSILAAANPKYGKYDVSMSLTDNIDIPVPLLSRFDLIWLIRDIVNLDEDTKKAEHVLNTFMGNDGSNKIFLNRDQLSSYLSYVHEIKPTITEEAKKKLASIYQQMRSLSASNESLAVGIRQLEALARLSTAHAKLLFKTQVDINDVNVVEALLRKMYESLGIKMDKGFTQTNLLVGKKESKEQLAYRIWNESMDENKNVKYDTFIKKLIDTKVFDETTAKALFSQWEMKCMIKLIGDGKYRKI